jgi:phosphoglycolate phosphatase
MRDVLNALRSQDWTLLGVATGKSKRGLDKLIEGHSLNGYFVTQQVADFHPSKPHPSMVLAALSDTGVDPDDAVIIGDTAFDIEMGRAAGIRTIGVNWGYHSVDRLAAAHRTVDHPTELLEAIDETLGA